MDIYSYAGFAYGLTALISLGTVGLILLINRMMNWIVHQAKYQSQTETEKEERADESAVAGGYPTRQVCKDA